jgi:hypothetical protein
MRLPTLKELVLGGGLSIAVGFLVITPLIKGRWTGHWQMPLAATAATVAAVMLVMKLEDRKKKRSVYATAKIRQDEDGFVSVECTGIGCDGRVSIRPVKGEDVLVRCPRCAVILAVGRDPDGNVMAYSPSKIDLP